MKFTDEEFRREARRQYEDEGRIEIDFDEATVSRGEGDASGAYVQAWVWVEFAKAEGEDA